MKKTFVLIASLFTGFALHAGASSVLTCTNQGTLYYDVVIAAPAIDSNTLVAKVYCGNEITGVESLAAGPISVTGNGDFSIVTGKDFSLIEIEPRSSVGQAFNANLISSQINGGQEIIVSCVQRSL